MKTIVTTLPSVSSSQNGPGSSSTTNYYDESNRLRWDLTAEGAVNYYSYDPETGGLALVVKDVNTFAALPTEITTTGSGNWIAWSGSAPLSRTSSDTAYALIEKIEYDELGRVTKRINPHGEPGEYESSEHYTVYETDKTVVYPYWDGTNATLPVEVTEFDAGGTITETYSVFPSEVSGSGGEPPATVGTPGQGKYSAWTRFTHDAVNGKLFLTDRYHDIPSTGEGTESTNFHRTAYGYDDLGRRDVVVNVVSGLGTTGVEQVTKTTYDKLGRVEKIERGVSGTGSGSNDIGSDYATLPTLATVSYNEWDDRGVGDGFLTAQVRYHGTGATNNTGSRLHRTFRGHLRGVEPFHTFTTSTGSHTSLGPYTHHDIDWQGRITVTATYSSEPTWTTSYSAHAESTTTNRLSLSRNKIDDLGRVYRTEEETISSSGTTGGGRFETNFYRDREGNLVAEQPTNSAATEYVYDNLGRMYQERTVSDLETTKFTSGAYNYRAPLPNTGGSVSGGDDGVLAFTHTDFDDAGNVVKEFQHDMNHADTNGMSGSATTSFVRAAVYNWYDDANRVDKTVNFGSGKGAAAANVWEYNYKPSYVYSTPPTTTNEYRLLTTYAYNGDSGRLEKVTDAAGKISKMFYDDLGRVTYVADNWVNFSTPDTGTGDATDKSKDQVTKNEYDGLGNVTAITALGGATGTSDDQETTYDFEDAYDASLVTRTTYPDSSGASDDVEMTYHLDGQLDSRTDQNGTVFDYDYTDWRGLERKKVTTLGTGVDGYVRSIGRTYDSRRRLDKLTSYSTDTGSTIRNELAYAYQDSWNKVYVEYQDHNGAADTTEPTTSPHVAYIYDETLGSSIFTNGLRLKSMIHPSGNTTDFYFDSTYNDRLHRIDRIRTDRRTGTAEDIVKYEYTGASRIVEVEYQTTNKVHLKYDPGDGDGKYEKLDRFGRVMYQRWGLASITRDRFAYTYDYSSNVLTRDFPAYVYSTNDRDQLYTYDGLNRLETFDEGTITVDMSGDNVITSPTYEQDWTLDSLGNWSSIDDDGTTQNRTHNKANEITQLDSSSTHVAHDAAGNITTVPQPGSWSTNFDLIYDAWNRLVEVKDGATTVAEYEYDGLHRRTVKTVGSDVKHFYYNTSWQVVEVRDASETGTTVEEYVWHPYYVDALAVRYWDSDEDGDYASTDETHYFTHDANYNITAALQTGSAVKERYLYKPYGGVEVVTAGFGAQSGSAIDNPYFFTGRRLDDETGLYHFRNRFYHAELGRFVSRDPLEYVDGMSLYGAYFLPGDLDPFGTKKRGTGHHIMPWSSFNGKVSDDVFDVFNADSARLHNECYKTHGYGQAGGVPHPDYNRAVKEKLRRFLKGRDISTMTKQEAEQFVKALKRMPPTSLIGKFNRGIKGQINRAIKEAAERAAKSGAKNVATRCCKKGIKAVLGKVPICGIAFFCADTARGGFDHAVEELVWPLGDIVDLLPKSPNAKPIRIGPPGFLCFTTGTLVHTAQGPVAIETIKKGDRVWSYDLDKEEWGLRPVVRSHANSYDDTIVTVSCGEEQLESTKCHPFWVVEGEDLEQRPVARAIPAEDRAGSFDGRWVAAIDLQIGDELLPRNSGTAKITNLQLARRKVTVFNISVSGVRNYTVGKAGVLVHNKRP